MFRTNVDEMNVEPINLGNELRYGVQFRLGLAPVVLRRPIAREFLHRCELHALRLIRDVFPLRPLRRVDAPAEIVERLLWDVNAEGMDCGCGSVRRGVELYSGELVQAALFLSRSSRGRERLDRAQRLPICLSGLS